MTEGAFQASPLRFTQPKTVIPCDLLSIYYRYGELCVIKKALITSLAPCRASIQPVVTRLSLT